LSHKPLVVLTSDMNDLSVQDRYAPNNHCFGCGPANPKGLRVKSHLVGDELVAEWQPSREHEAFDGMVCGGILGTLLDCHSNWAAAVHLMARRGADAPPCTVTAEYKVELKRPTPSDAVLRLRAKVVEATDNRATVEATVEAGGNVCATCRGVFVAVKPGHPAYHRW
jgi:acyl-coenzyme A thioesterase PaaI-like protein